jgi:hypothetical protein
VIPTRLFINSKNKKNMQLNLENIVVFGVFVLYTIVSISHAIKGNYAWASVWGGYAVANVGLLIAQSKI